MAASIRAGIDDDGLGPMLRRHGYRLTSPRRSVWNVLVEADRHMTAEQIARRVARDDEGVNLASIYRALSLFATLGLARETRLGIGGGVRWELAHTDNQFHLVCSGCGSVEHHGGALVGNIKDHLEKDHAFVVADVQLAVSGFCSACEAPHRE
ncbi:MAG: transcriptional repressor [Acidimicrobiia bacterium]|nr:transcriptional repressor [Acidimicrobiia bacterium]